MNSIQEKIQKVKLSESFSLSEIEWLETLGSTYELTALYYHIVFGEKKYPVLLSLLKNKIDKKYFYENLYKEGLSNKYLSIINKVHEREELVKKEFDFISEEIFKGTVDLNLLTVFLVSVYYLGLSDSSTNELTLSMLHSGNIYDYRGGELNNYKLVRRYPTGALSEKIAILLPAVIAHYAEKHKIYSPFLIAKSLGFTGGTWDKLSSIPNIKFIKQGNDLVNILKKVGVAYCMTEFDIAPFDKFLYQFRSLTGTIESESLIVSSIASKQLAIPADVLVMDIRYGDGAFLPNYAEAEKTGEQLKHILVKNGMNCTLCYTDTPQPNGTCIGNYWEIYEAICLLKGIYENKILSKKKSMKQVELVIQMFLLIIQELNLNIDIKKIKDELVDKFKSGVFYHDFLKILETNHVESTTIDSIFSMDNQYEFHKTNICCCKSGVLHNIHQKEIGNYVNYYLGNNNYNLSSNYFNYSGIVLHVDIEDRVKQGDTLCTVIHDKEKIIDQNYLQSLFSIK